MDRIVLNVLKERFVKGCWQYCLFVLHLSFYGSMLILEWKQYGERDIVSTRQLVVFSKQDGSFRIRVGSRK